jgi:hypothetical protein
MMSEIDALREELGLTVEEVMYKPALMQYLIDMVNGQVVKLYG